MKKLTIIILISLLALWVFDILDNEKLIWAVTVAVPALIALWKNNEVRANKKIISQKNKQLADMHIRNKNLLLQNENLFKNAYGGDKPKAIDKEM